MDIEFSVSIVATKKLDGIIILDPLYMSYFSSPTF